MTIIKMHIPKAKLPFYPPCEVKCMLQNGVSIYCRFHRDYGHDTADCYDLKQQIEALIREGKLQKFVSKERTDTHPREQAPRRENDHPRPLVGDIRMIVGGTAITGLSKKARKTYLRMVQNVQLTGYVPKR